MNKNRKTVQARLVKKLSEDYYPIPGRVPEPTKVYDLLFCLENQADLVCSVSRFEYEVLEEGDQGELVYEGNQIISFANKLHEFHID